VTEPETVLAQCLAVQRGHDQEGLRSRTPAGEPVPDDADTPVHLPHGGVVGIQIEGHIAHGTVDGSGGDGVGVGWPVGDRQGELPDLIPAIAGELQKVAQDRHVRRGRILEMDPQKETARRMAPVGGLDGRGGHLGGRPPLHNHDLVQAAGQRLCRCQPGGGKTGDAGEARGLESHGQRLQFGRRGAIPVDPVTAGIQSSEQADQGRQCGGDGGAATRQEVAAPGDLIQAWRQDP
jgi:hypothetical protein